MYHVLRAKDPTRAGLKNPAFFYIFIAHRGCGIVFFMIQWSYRASLFCKDASMAECSCGTVDRTKPDDWIGWKCHKCERDEGRSNSGYRENSQNNSREFSRQLEDGFDLLNIMQ